MGATDAPFAIDVGMLVIKTMLSENFVRRDEANRIQSLVREKGQHTLIDKIKVRYLSDDEKAGQNLAAMDTSLYV